MNKPENVNVTIFNILGQVVDERNYGTQRAGFKRVQWSPNAPAGTYIARIQIGDKVFTEKMALADGSSGNGLSDILAGSSPNLEPVPVPENNQPGLAKASLSPGTYRIRINDPDYLVFTSNEFQYDGTALNKDLYLIPSGLDFSEYYDNWLHMFRELTHTNWFGASKNTKITRSLNPAELYGVTTDTPQDWLPYVREAFGDSNNTEGRGWEDLTGLDLFVEKEGAMGEAEEGKTKIQIRYVHREDMPPGGGTARFVPGEPSEDRSHLLTGTIYFNIDVMPYLGDLNSVYAIAAHELGRALNLNDSSNPTHIMSQVGVDHFITDQEAKVAKIFYKLPLLTDMAQYSEH